MTPNCPTQTQYVGSGQSPFVPSLNQSCVHFSVPSWIKKLHTVNRRTGLGLRTDTLTVTGSFCICCSIKHHWVNNSGSDSIRPRRLQTEIIILTAATQGTWQHHDVGLINVKTQSHLQLTLMTIHVDANFSQNIMYNIQRNVWILYLEKQKRPSYMILDTNIILTENVARNERITICPDL